MNGYCLRSSSIYFRRRKTNGIIFKGEISERNSLVAIKEQSIPLGPAKKLLVPDINVSPEDRIAIIGENGTGKSTLINFLIREIRLLPEHVVYIPQEIDTLLWEKTRDAMQQLDGGSLGLMLTAVHRLGSEPDRVIHSKIPSPGEMRKIMLALGLLKNPSLIILDKPTNHMDIPSIQCLENALCQYNGGLIIVSHDRAFIRNTTDIIWEIVRSGSDLKLTI